MSTNVNSGKLSRKRSQNDDNINSNKISIYSFASASALAHTKNIFLNLWINLEFLFGFLCTRQQTTSRSTTTKKKNDPNDMRSNVNQTPSFEFCELCSRANWRTRIFLLISNSPNYTRSRLSANCFDSSTHFASRWTIFCFFFHRIDEKKNSDQFWSFVGCARAAGNCLWRILPICFCLWSVIFESQKLNRIKRDKATIQDVYLPTLLLLCATYSKCTYILIFVVSTKLSLLP